MSFPEEEYKALDILKENPHSTQREVASKLGFSLGKTHYVLRALIDKGLIKVTNFTKSDNKIGYIYQLTPNGILQKAILTKNFLKIKVDEYEKLKQEIVELEKKVKNHK